MTTTDLIRTWQNHSEPKVDLLALAQCTDSVSVIPQDIAGTLWVFVQTNRSQSELRNVIAESPSLVMQLKRSSKEIVMLQIRPAEFNERVEELQENEIIQ